MRSPWRLIVSMVVVGACSGGGAGGGSGDGGLPENHAPLADAGPLQNVHVGSVVTLDGAASSDPDGDELDFAWSFASIPSGSTASLSGAATVRPTFTADLEGVYTIELVVDDGRLGSADTVTVTAVRGNVAPIANAGLDRGVTTGARVILDASASSDADGDPLTYRWSITTMPATSAAILSSTTAVNPAFTADRDGSYVVSLVVNDGRVDSEADTVTIAATTTNSAPVANAGRDQNVETGSVVTLDGSASNDADGNLIAYSWSFTSRPPGSAAVLVNPASARPTFIADRGGTYVIQLVVNDGIVNSDADTMAVTAATANSAPVANAGPDQSVATGSLVTLDAGASRDADNDPLTYSWAFIVRPAGSSATLANPTWVRPTFTADHDGSYVIGLVVDDGKASSAVDTVTVTAAPGNTAPVADAGLDQNVKTGSLVTLNGLLSRDADNDPLTNTWSFISKPEGSSASLSDPTGMFPSFTADRDGSYVISLIVNDGKVNSLPDTVTIVASTGNSAPVVYAGQDYTTRTGFYAWLRGSAWDADGDPVAVTWWFISRPPGSTATILAPTSVSTSFKPDLDGSYVIGLVANDGKVDSAVDSVTITALPTDIAPVANAGPDQSVTTGLRVTLSGWATDADGDWPLSFNCSIVSRPAGSAAVLSNPAAWAPTFLADRDGSYVFSLVVSDGFAFSEPDTVTVTASYQNLAPVADAGYDQNVAVGAVVTLDGSASTDINHDGLTYAWSFTSRPTGSKASLASPSSVKPTFTADVDGVYVLSLVVSDGTLSSAPDSVTIATMPRSPTDCTDGLRVGMTFELGTMGEAHGPQAATNANGAAVVVWLNTDYLTGQSSLWARRCLLDRGWTPAVRLDRATGSALEPDVAIDGNGDAIAVWRERDGAQYSAYASRALATADWEAATLIEGSSGEVLEPRVAISDAGGATAVWRQWNGTTWTLVANHHTWSSGWDTEQLLSNGIVEAAYHQVVMDDIGRTMVVWRYWTYPSSSFSGSLYWSLHSPSTGWTVPARLDQAIGSAGASYITMNRDGAVAVWITTYGDTAGMGLFVSRFGSAWGSPVKLTEVSAYALAASAWLSPRGVALVVWGVASGAGSGVVVAASNAPPATTWTTTGLSGYHLSSGGGRILGDGTETPIAVWTDYGTSSLYANRFNPDTGWGPETLLRTGPPFPVALERDQDLLFIWRSDNDKKLQAARQLWP